MKPRRAVRLLAIASLATAFAAAGARGADTPDEHGFFPVKADPPYESDATGKYGGTLIWAEMGECDTFHPLVSNSATTNELRSLVFDSLVGYDNGKWDHVPLLAASWEHSQDGKTWTFHLRKGVKWSDGESFTSKDVLFSWAALTHPKIENSDVDNFKIGDNPLPTVEAPDDFTVVFHCSVVDALFVMNIGNMSIAPAHLWAKTIEGDSPTYPGVMGVNDVARVVGTGPYRVVEYKPGEKVVYDRNPYSWRTDKSGARLPYPDHVIVKLVKDMNTRTLQFLNGDLDVIDDIPAPDYKAFKDKEAEGWFKLHRLNIALNTNYVCFNQHPGADATTKEPYVAPYKLKWFQDARFRRAMSHACNRENLVKQILDGKGAPIYTDTTKANKTWYAETTTFPYAVDKANKLLDEMGLAKRDADGIRMDEAGHRVSIELMTNVENDTRVKIIGQLKNDWAAVGVEAVLLPRDFNSVTNAMDSTHKWEAIMLGWGSGVPPDPLNGKNILLSSGRLHNWYPQQPKPCNEFEAKCDAIIGTMSQELDVPKRVAMWAQLLELHAQEQPIIYLYANNTYAASKKRVMNSHPSILRPETWWNVDELWLEDGK
jgi:peptide/nickel transport system substrate-binding protein